MGGFNRILLILHFLGLALGFSVSIANLVMSRLLATAPPPEKAVLGLAAVVLLTATVLYIHRLESRVQRGDAAALVRIQSAGKVASSLAVIALIFAVLTFR